MPTKLNKAGNQQEYVPAGNGDASGEYGFNSGENKGGNKHFQNFKKPNGNKVIEEKSKTDNFDNFDENDFNTIKSVSQKAKDNLIKHLTNKNDENNKTLNEVIDNTTDNGQIILNNFLEDNETFSIRFGNAGRNAAGVCYGNSIVCNHEIGVVRHEIGHSFDDLQARNNNLEKKTKYGYSPNLTTDYLDENGKCMNDIIHEELGIHPFEVNLKGHNFREIKTGVDKRADKITKAKELCQIYEETMNEYLDNISGEKDANKTIKELTLKSNELDDIVRKEVITKLKETKEYQDYENINNQIQEEQHRYEQERRNKGYYSIVYNNDPTIKKLREEKYKLLNAKWQKEDEIKKELKKSHPEIMTQEEMEKLTKLREDKGTMWKYSHGIDGIIGDTLDYMGVGNYSSYSTRGHGSNYFKQKKSWYVQEIFANMFDCYLNKDNAKWNAVKKMLPKTSNMFEKIVKKFGIKEN